MVSPVSSCQRYFLDHAQHTIPVQALSSFLNIDLPIQKPPQYAPTSGQGSSSPVKRSISLIPYLRRLVATGMDFPGILQAFFGDNCVDGIGPLHKQERRNYFFAAKSGGWASVKREYDILPYETVPFLQPLRGAMDAEIETVERSWAHWLAMEDWMVGPRAPKSPNSAPSQGPMESE